MSSANMPSAVARRFAHLQRWLFPSTEAPFAERQADWLAQRPQRPLVAMLDRLPPRTALDVAKRAFLASTGSDPDAVPVVPEDLYEDIRRLVSGAGIAFGRGGQSAADYEATVRGYVETYHTLIDALGETNRFKRDRFDRELDRS